MSEADDRLLRALAPFAMMGGAPIEMLAFSTCDPDMTVWRYRSMKITVAQVREARAAIIAVGGLPKPPLRLADRSRGRFT